LQLPTVALADLKRRISKPLHQLLCRQANYVTACVRGDRKGRLSLFRLNWRGLSGAGGEKKSYGEDEDTAHSAWMTPAVAARKLPRTAPLARRRE